MRWLGVWLDLKLKYDVYIECWAYKAYYIIYHLYEINNIVQGILAIAARRAVWAVVMPILFYGADIWYKGNLVLKRHIRTLQKVLTAAYKMVLPMWKTIPYIKLWKEVGIPPADLLLEQITEQNINRQANLDAAYPITQRNHFIQYSHNPESTKQTIIKATRLYRNLKQALLRQHLGLIL